MELKENHNYKRIELEKWGQLINFEKNHRSNLQREGKETEWIFKGMPNSNYRLLTTLERDVANIEGIDPNKDVRKLKELLKEGLKVREESRSVPINEIEDGLIRKFKRQCHHYNTQTPEEDNILEWLALMRHYGAPSRLLDWTYSFYVALFFAVSEAKPEKDCAVWALDKRSIIKELQMKEPAISTILENDEHVTRQTWKRVFKSRNPDAFVYPANPFRLNERLVIQQGDFLCPGDIMKTFEENLDAVLHGKSKLIKCIIKWNPEERRDMLLNLHKMNINRATLFPGLGGFAQSLKILMVSPENLIKSDSDYKRKESTGVKGKK